MNSTLPPTSLSAGSEPSDVDRLRAELAQQKRNLRLLREVALASRGAADPQSVFEAIYERLKEVLPVDAFFVALCDRGDTQQYHFALFIDEDKRVEATDQQIGGLTGWILDLKESRLFRDLHAERGSDAPVPQQFGNYARRSRAWMAVPLMIGRESVGVISVQSYQYGVYSEVDLQLLEALGDLAAIAIENALLYRQQDELSKSLATRAAARSEELAVLTTIASGLSRGQYDEQKLAEALERILWMLNLGAGVVWLADPSSGLRRAAAYAVAGSRHQALAKAETSSVIPDPISAQVFQHNQPIIRRSRYSGADQEPGLLSTAVDSDDESVFAVPLQAHGHIVGVLALYDETGRELAPHEYSLLEAASQQMAIGVENARLYHEARTTAAIAERRADNLALVHRISRLISSSLDPGEVVRITAEQMVKLFDVDHCAIMLFDESGTRGEIVAEYPLIGTIGSRATFVPGQDYLETEPGRGQPGYVTDIEHDPRIRALRGVARRFGVQAILLVPLISRGRSVGAIGLNQMHRLRTFSEEEIELCRTIAAQVAIALENARFYQRSVTHVEQEMQIAGAIQANLFPRSLPAIPGAALAGRCLPALETGGDFYDVLPVGERRFGFSIGDVSGKSLPAAMLMAVARSIVRSEAIDHATPEQVATETNSLVVQDVPPNTFVSLCYAVYEADTRRMVLANAGHITPLLRRPDGTVELLPVVSNLPLGIVPQLDYEASEVQLARGDSVLFLTDGLVEAFAPDGAMFGFERLAHLFSECGSRPAGQVVSELLNTVVEWQGSGDRNDDMTALVLQVL